jgi:hypothetical protein
MSEAQGSTESIQSSPQVPAANLSEDSAPQAPIQGGADTFDQLEQLQAQESESKAKNRFKPKKGKESKDESIQESASEEKSSTEKEASKKSEEVIKEASKPAKLIKAKVGDSTLEIAENAVFPVKRNGKVEELPISEILAGYGGTKEVEKRFSQLAEEKKTFYNYVSGIGNAIKEGNVRVGIEHLAAMVGIDAEKAWTAFYEPIHNQALETAQLTEAEREAIKWKKELEHHKTRESFSAKQKAQLDEESKVEAQINASISSLGVSMDEFTEAFNAVEQAKKAGQFHGAITPEVVSDYIKSGQIAEKSISILSELYADEVKPAWTRELAKAWRMNPDLTEQDIREMAQEAFGKPQKIIQEEKKQKFAEKVAKKQEERPRSKIDNALMFDDLF